MHFKNNNLHAANELIDCVYSIYQLGGVITDIENAYGLTRGHSYYISKLESRSLQPLAALLNARSSVILDIDYDVFNQLIEQCINCSDSDINVLMRGVNENFTFKHTPECQLLQNFVHIMYSQLDSLFDTGTQFKTSIPSKTISLLSNLSGYRKSVLAFFLINKDVFKFRIDHASFTFAVRAFETKKNNVDAVHDLIKMGADYLFVRNYNGFCDVCLAYFTFMRKVYDIKIQPFASFELYKLTDAYAVYNESLAKNSYKESVIAAHKSTKLPIAIIIEAIQRFEEDSDELDDDDFADIDEILEITSRTDVGEHDNETTDNSSLSNDNLSN